ncbi:rod shape-determining protein [Stratiformator vulcanicus]|uniref:Cell shape-determining protein MreB n=1 Tax=Stratiformator vulcanicus TaxID=2527980 RepID=A0A517R3Q9_9PLAN|nr:rod shape-determining protein [Stratiformator vulcanicus]QDT38496.1 Rod shape-determining protein MreB [Stratiformator vulcanicus]
MFAQVRHQLCPDLAIDLGTHQTRVAVGGRGLILDEPSVVAVDSESRRILGGGAAVGRVAKQMIGRTPDGITAAYPIRGSVVHDFDLCEAMLGSFLRKTGRSKLGLKPRVLMTVPGAISPVERRAVTNAAERAGAGDVFLIEQSRAAAVGAGLPISEPIANWICQIGAGTTDIAVLSLGDIVVRRARRVAGEAFDEAIAAYLRREYSLKVGSRTAERIKHEIGSADPLDEELVVEVSGIDTAGAVPRKAVITSEDVREAIAPVLQIMTEELRATVESCDPELAADLADVGLVLSGGGAQLRRLPEYFERQLGVPVRLVDDPARVVIRGTALCVDHFRQWRPYFESAA